MKKIKHFHVPAPEVNSLSEANALIQQLWEKLREYEDRLAANSRNSSRSPSSDSPAAKAERKKLQRLTEEIRLVLSQATPDTGDR
jgi:hypothetical protein